MNQNLAQCQPYGTRHWTRPRVPLLNVGRHFRDPARYAAVALFRSNRLLAYCYSFMLAWYIRIINRIEFNRLFLLKCKSNQSI